MEAEPTIGVDREAAPAAELPTPLLKFGRYDVLGRLAVGGMAEIFLGEEPVGSNSRQVIIKVLHRQLRADGAFEDLFLNEGSIAMQLAHPNICAVYEFAKEAGHFYISMEYVDGVSLWQLLGRLTKKRERMPAPIAVAIVARVASALEYAHSARDSRRKAMNVIHRDVSPHNIMLRFDGVVKLLDFGVAKMKQREESVERSTVKGKSAYLSPEQCRAQPIDGRTDVFSLGVCLAESLTGRRLYRRGSAFDTIKSIVEEPVPSMHALVSSIPDDLDAIVAKALAKDPADRYESAGKFQVALERWLMKHDYLITDRSLRHFLDSQYDEHERAPTLERGPEAIERLQKGIDTTKKRISLTMVAALVMIVMIAFAGVGWAMGGTDEPTPTTTHRPDTPATSDTTDTTASRMDEAAPQMDEAPQVDGTPPEITPDVPDPETDTEIPIELETEVEPEPPATMMRRWPRMRRIVTDPGF